jgi:hypothetical protein
MKQFDWDEGKNDRLIAERGISFERIVIAIESGAILDTLAHPNQALHAGQYLYVLEIDGQAWVVPWEDRDKLQHLVTAFPSRKYTAIYLEGTDENDA